MKIIKIGIRIILGIVAIYLLYCSGFMATVSNFNIGIVATGLLGMIIAIYGIFFEKINKSSSKGFLKYFRYFVYFGFACLIAMVSFIGFFGKINNVTYEEDAIIVLGAGIRGSVITYPLAYRLQTACEYVEKNPNAVIVVSGGKGNGEDITEALAMERYLLRKGIPKEQIIKEEKSTSTYENLKFSKELLDEKFDNDYSTAVITNNFHIYRATRMSEIVGLNSTHLNAQIQAYSIPINYLREVLAVCKLWLFGI